MSGKSCALYTSQNRGVNIQRKPGIIRCLLVLSCFLLFSCALRAQPGNLSWGSQINITVGDYSRMAHLTNGSWLACCTIYSGDSYIAIYKSTDNCQTWSASPISTVGVAGRRLDNGYLIQLANGTVLLAVRNNNYAPPGGQFATDYSLDVYKSTDQGQSWTLLSTIDSQHVGSTSGLWEPVINQLEDGSLVASYSNETHPGYSQIISQRLSSDNGATWGNEIWAVNEIGGGSLRPGMPEMARMANGNYIMVFEVAPSGNGAHYKVSYDGFTWPGGLGPQIPLQETGPFVLALSDGRLLVSSGGNHLMLSTDSAATWTEVTAPWHYDDTFPAFYETMPGQLAWISGIHDAADHVAVSIGTISPIFNNEAPIAAIVKTNAATALYAVATNGNVWTLFQTTSNGTWSSWTSLGGSELSTTPYSPSPLWHVKAVSQADGTQVLFAQAKPAGPIYTKQQTSAGGNGSWASTWTSLGGTSSTFDAQVYPDGTMAVYGLSRGVLWTTWQNTRNGSWATWASLGNGGTELTRVHMLTQTDGTSIAYCLDINGHIWTTWQSTWGGAWSGWVDMGNTFDSFEAVLYPGGNMGLFGTSGGQLWTRWQNVRGGGWSSWAFINGAGLHNLHAIQEPNGATAVFDTGWPNNDIWTTWQATQGGAWDPGIDLGGPISDLTPVVYPSGRIALFGISGGTCKTTSESAFLGSWSGWSTLGGGPFFPQ